MRRGKEEPGERLTDCPHKRHTRSRHLWQSALRFALPALQPGRVSRAALDLRIPSLGAIELLLAPPVLEREEAAGPGGPGRATRARTGRSALLGGADIPVRSLASPPEAELGAEAFEPLPDPTVRRCVPLGPPGIRKRPLIAANSRVMSVRLLGPPCAVPEGKRKVGLLARPEIFDRSRRFGRMPHSRRSIDLASLGERQRLDYLREAEILRGVPPEHGELLAVFTRVPVELVARIRYLADHGLLLYTVARAPGLQRTRLHDLAAVRNGDSGGVHLVAHRTRYRTVFLI